MTLIQISIILVFSSSLMITMYKPFATKFGFPIGQYFDSDVNIINISSMLLLIASFIYSFFEFQWFVVLIGAIIIWIITGSLIRRVFKSHSQWISLLLLISGIVVGILNFI